MDRWLRATAPRFLYVWPGIFSRKCLRSVYLPLGPPTRVNGVRPDSPKKTPGVVFISEVYFFLISKSALFELHCECPGTSAHLPGVHARHGRQGEAGGGRRVLRCDHINTVEYFYFATIPNYTSAPCKTF